MKSKLLVKDFDSLFELLKTMGYQIIGPTLIDEVIQYSEISGPCDLPQGWTDEQAPGRYQIKKRQDQAYFGFVVGPHSWKSRLFPAKEKLWSASKTEQGFQVTLPESLEQKVAFFGVRGCELAAINIQDRVFMGSQYQDQAYLNRRENALIIAVNCNQAGNMCFCTSMDTGPEVKADFDLCLTEILEGEEHFFVVESGSVEGQQILEKLPVQSLQKSEQQFQQQVLKQAKESITKTLDSAGIRELLYQNSEHPHWQEVAERCLSCTNCTMVCPSCFCSSVEDVTDLQGENAERWRHWDSCFTIEHSYIHGGSIRKSTASQYKQWMTHKLASWIDQFGSSGCVGCGRCITWCPVGIDITEEVKALRKDNSK